MHKIMGKQNSSGKAEKNVKLVIKRLIIGFAVIFGLILLLSLSVHKFISYQPGEKALTALKGNDKVTVTKVRRGLLFDGPGTEKAIIFYPGALVEYEAYAPLMLRLAEEGYDCFLVRLPFNMAFCSVDRGAYYLENYGDQYDTWYACGHSLGGAMVSRFVNMHSEEIDGMIFLAAYPTDAFLNENIKVLSIYGDHDGVLNMTNFAAGRELMPAYYSESSISGGNHASFGDYGTQKGDNEALITSEEQIEITVQEIKKMDSLGILR